MVKPIATISVTPNLPPELERLRTLAYNLRWSWDHDTVALFRRLDNDLWFSTGRNPVWMLGLVSQERLQEVLQDTSFMAQFERVWDAYSQYMEEPNTWYVANYGKAEKPYVAYFSMEFGITTCLRNYSGGLGVLSGDHIKSASDLGLPLVGVGLLYQEGYFEQYLNAGGYQQESYPINDYANQPVEPVLDAEGERIVISVSLGQQTLYAWAWKAQVGRTPLYLLDANHPDNSYEMRDLTDRLYGGDRRVRIRQEILLGIGGMRLLEALGVEAAVVHMNEGHSAFSALERTRQLMKQHPGLKFAEARDILATGCAYTIHTPVPAGLERFGFDLIDEHFPWLWKELGLTREQFHDLGREQMGGYDLFSLPVMALKFASGANGVSQLHGEVSRSMWQWMFPNVPEAEVPVKAVTNGVHVQTWVSREMGDLFDRYLPPVWRTDSSHEGLWREAEKIPDAELWRTHERRRERLVSFARQRLGEQLKSRGATASEIAQAEEVLNPDALTIGFARRFATYKRATLIFRDIERLKKIINNAQMPLQIIFAGKAHPHDQPGKELIREIVESASIADFRHSIVFLENYDMTVGRYMTQGVDVWLNTPRRPKEASGTSGMKVIYNGGLNASILDGWWAEAYKSELGWAIGKGEEYAPGQEDLQDYIESQALYNMLENDMVPMFYNRGRDGLPREWIRMVKNSIIELSAFFSTDRMLKEYHQQYYYPAYNRFTELTKPDLQRGKEYAAWLEKVKAAWKLVKIVDVQTTATNLKVGSSVSVKAVVELGELAPEDVSVQLYSGSLNTKGVIENGSPVEMKENGGSKGKHVFEGTVSYGSSGERGISVRVIPNHPDLAEPFLTGFVRWAGE